MLISRRNARHEFCDGSSEEGLGLDLCEHKSRLRIQIRQSILEVAGDHRLSKARVFEAASSCLGGEGTIPARTLLEGPHLLQSMTESAMLNIIACLHSIPYAE